MISEYKIRKFLKSLTTFRVSKEAVSQLKTFLEKFAEEVLLEAEDLTRRSGRKVITGLDLYSAVLLVLRRKARELA